MHRARNDARQIRRVRVLTSAIAFAVAALLVGLVVQDAKAEAASIEARTVTTSGTVLDGRGAAPNNGEVLVAFEAGGVQRQTWLGVQTFEGVTVGTPARLTYDPVNPSDAALGDHCLCGPRTATSSLALWAIVGIALTAGAAALALELDHRRRSQVATHLAPDGPSTPIRVWWGPRSDALYLYRSNDQGVVAATTGRPIDQNLSGAPLGVVRMPGTFRVTISDGDRLLLRGAPGRFGAVVLEGPAGRFVPRSRLMTTRDPHAEVPSWQKIRDRLRPRRDRDRGPADPDALYRARLVRSVSSGVFLPMTSGLTSVLLLVGNWVMVDPWLWILAGSAAAAVVFGILADPLLHTAGALGRGRTPAGGTISCAVLPTAPLPPPLPTRPPNTAPTMQTLFPSLVRDGRTLSQSLTWLTGAASVPVLVIIGLVVTTAAPILLALTAGAAIGAMLRGRVHVEQRYRRTIAPWWLGAAPMALAAAAWVVAADVDQVGHSVALRSAAAITVVPLWWLSWRILRTGVVVTSEEWIVRNVLQHHRVPIADLVRVEQLGGHRGGLRLVVNPGGIVRVSRLALSRRSAAELTTLREAERHGLVSPLLGP